MSAAKHTAPRVAVFLGPSLDTSSAAAACPGAELLPPVRQGDVLRALRQGYDSLVLIDGVFEQTPAVWHKELLAALAQGVRVIGAASMGALRAAELDRHGMEGVGWVYRQYAAGLADDDEVALLHADAELGYANLSVPMIQLRFVLAHSEADDPVHRALAPLVDRIKARFYPERSAAWLADLLAAQGHSTGLVEAVLQRLCAASHSVKRQDALAALGHLESPRPSRPLPAQQHTVFMQRLVRSLGLAEGAPRQREWLALALAERDTAAALPLAQRLLGQWQRERGLFDRAAVSAYLSARRIQPSDFFAYFKACAELQQQLERAPVAQRQRAQAFVELI